MDHITSVYTYSVCESIFDEEEIPNHACFSNKEHLYIDDNRYLYPKSSETAVHETSDTQEGSSEMVDIDERLIIAVQQRPALYNYKLPLLKRSRLTLRTLWQEISDELNGALNPTEATKKWRLLRDSYFQEVSRIQKSSGSAASIKKRKWKYFNILSFLSDATDKRRTISNIEESQDAIAGPSSPVEPSVEFNVMRRQKENKRNANRETVVQGHLQQICDALATPTESPVDPPLPTLDELDHFGALIVSQLRTLSLRQRRRVMAKINTI